MDESEKDGEEGRGLGVGGKGSGERSKEVAGGCRRGWVREGEGGGKKRKAQYCL